MYSMSKSPSGRSLPSATVYHLGPQHAGLTLAAAMKELQAQSSWSIVKQWIAKRQVQVNGNLCMDPARRVQERDVVKLFAEPLPRPVAPSDLRVVHLDEHLLVVEKPAGVTSVRTAAEQKLSMRRRQLQPTLEELLPPVLAKMQRLRWPPLPPPGMNKGKKSGPRPSQLGRIQNAKKLPPEYQVFPVHRLDRDTSGLMLFARTRAAEQRLMNMFRRHTIDRQYLAVCLGHILPQTIESRLVRDRGDGVRGSLCSALAPPAPAPEAEQTESAGERAVTHIVTSEHFVASATSEPYSLIRCRLETGRTHQIRIHLSEAGHVLCGDKIYCGDRYGQTTVDRSGAPRQALHSDQLAFTHPFTGQHLKFYMPLPADLASWLKVLRGRA